MAKFGTMVVCMKPECDKAFPWPGKHACERREGLCNDCLALLEKRAVAALLQTWSAIGYDVLAAYGNPERVSLKAPVVRDAVSSCGFIGGFPEDYGNDLEAVKWLAKQSRTTQDRILALAFPKGSYGA